MAGFNAPRGGWFIAPPDNLGTVRQRALYNDGSGTTSIVDRRSYDAFGNLTHQSGSHQDHLIGFTGRPFDAHAGLQNNLNRWYDATTGRWISEDPIKFEAGDANLSRYVSNDPTNAVDPDGLEKWRVKTLRAAIATVDPYLDDFLFRMKDQITPRTIFTTKSSGGVEIDIKWIDGPINDTVDRIIIRIPHDYSLESAIRGLGQAVTEKNSDAWRAFSADMIAGDTTGRNALTSKRGIQEWHSRRLDQIRSGFAEIAAVAEMYVKALASVTLTGELVVVANDLADGKATAASIALLPLTHTKSLSMVHPTKAYLVSWSA